MFIICCFDCYYWNKKINHEHCIGCVDYKRFKKYKRSKTKAREINFGKCEGFDKDKIQGFDED